MSAISLSDTEDGYDTEKEKSKLAPKGKKRKHRQQKYRKDWEREDEFKFWLTSDRNDKFNAKCTICNVSLKAEVSVLKLHGKSAKHHAKCTGNFLIAINCFFFFNQVLV